MPVIDGRYYAEAPVKPSVQKLIDEKRAAADKEAEAKAAEKAPKAVADEKPVRDDVNPSYTLPEAAKAEKKPFGKV